MNNITFCTHSTRFEVTLEDWDKLQLILKRAASVSDERGYCFYLKNKDDQSILLDAIADTKVAEIAA